MNGTSASSSGHENISRAKVWTFGEQNTDRPESSSLVSLSGLKRAYEILQLGTTDDTQTADPTEINVEAHFAVVDSFDMPAVHFDAVRGGFTTWVSDLSFR